jgi:hypothetical protein
MSRPLDLYAFDGPVIVLSGPTAYALSRTIHLADLAGAVRDEDVQTELLALLRFAVEYRRRTSVTSAVTEPAHPAQQPPPSLHVETAAAARTLGIGSAGVRQAIRRNRLPAVKVDGHWQLDPADLVLYGGNT